MSQNQQESTKEKSWIEEIQSWLTCSAPKYAKTAKTILQMFIGLGITALLVGRLIRTLAGDELALSEPNILKDVSVALLYSAAVELAYMLFTPGPDEAVEPVILSIAALILSLAARADSLIEGNQQANLFFVALSIGILAIAIGLLFFVRKLYLKESTPCSPQKPAPDSANRPITVQINEIKAHVTTTSDKKIILPSMSSLFGTRRRNDP